MSDSTLFDCTRCGACCRCFSIFASAADGEREPLIKAQTLAVDANLRAEGKYYQLYPLPFLRGCAFLGEDELCSIYETRPEVCRRFEKGSDQCLEARRRKGIGGS